MNELDHHVHVKTSRSVPSGRSVYVTLDGVEFTDLSSVKVEFSNKELNMVTLTFPARVTMEETE